MPDRESPVPLRIEPHAIPALRAAFDEAAAEVGRQVARLQQEGRLREPWLGDETSLAVREFYNAQVMDAPDGPYAALVEYSAELSRVGAALQRMEEGYRRTEGANAERWGRP